ncbi:MAG: S8 family serine peptidase [Patescibacteria group bacterium]
MLTTKSVFTSILLILFAVTSFFFVLKVKDIDPLSLVAKPNLDQKSETNGNSNASKKDTSSVDSASSESVAAGVDTGTASSMETDSTAVSEPVVTDTEPTLSEPKPAVSVIDSQTLLAFSKNGKIDPAITEAFKNGSTTIPVIIKAKLSFSKFYNPADSSSSRINKSNEFDGAKNQLAATLGSQGKIKRDLKIINGLSADINKDSLVALSKSPLLERVSLDREVQAFLDTSLDEINAKYVWTLKDGNNNPVTGKGIRIAVIDTGVDYTHPDLGGCLGSTCKVVGGYDFYNNDSNPMDDHGHGTHVAATAAGKGIVKDSLENDLQLYGVAPDASILAYKVMSAAGSGYFSTVIAGVNRAVDPNNDGNPADHADVGSMSLGANCGAAYTPDCGPDDPQSLAVDNATAAGVTFVIAAGNSGSALGTIGTPGVARSVITVAAACKTSQTGGQCTYPITGFSSRGPVIWNGVDLQKPDIAAPGYLICAAKWGNAFSTSPTCFDTKHVRISGTSMATPHVAGVVALIKQANPLYTPDQIKVSLKYTAKNLGMTYNDQGTGEVDVKAALSLTTNAFSTPIFWSLTTDPSRKNSLTNKSFSVTPKDTSTGNLSLSFSTSTPGITFSFDKATLNVANKTTDTFQATISVDNDVVKPGNYVSAIYLNENGVRKSTIPVFITVTPTLLVTPGTLDYGVDSPALSSWTSKTLKVTLVNKRTDIDQTLNVKQSIIYSPYGVIYNTGSPTVVALRGSTTTLDTYFTADNSKAENAVHGGTLTLSNNFYRFDIYVTFIKNYVLAIKETSGTVFQAVPKITIINRNNRWPIGVSLDSNPKIFYLDSMGPYDIMIDYPMSPDDRRRFVFKEGVTVDGLTGSTTLPVSISEAKHLIQFIPKDKNNNTLSTVSGSLEFIHLPTNQSFFGFISALGVHLPGTIKSIYVSDLSTNYLVKAPTSAHNSTETREDFYYLYAESKGISRGMTFTNSPSDLKSYTVQFDENRPAGTTEYPDLEDCNMTPYIHFLDYKSMSCSGNGPGALTLPYTQTIYTMRPPGYFAAFVSNQFRHGCPSTGACPSVFKSPYIDFATNSRFPFISSTFYPIDPSIISPLTGTKVYLGLGPSVWFAKFQNSPNILKILANFKGPVTPILRQDYATGENDQIPFVIKKDGLTVSTGSLKACVGLTGLACVNYDSDVLSTVNLPSSGKYEFSASFPYQNQSQNLTGSVVASFDTTLADPNPPTIKRLYYFSKGARSDVYDPAVSNTIELEFDPVGGSMKSVLVSYSVDGTNFIPLSVTSAGAVYQAGISSSTASGKITLRIIASDNADNSLQYTFELPLGSAPSSPSPLPNPVPNPTPSSPTVSITSPVSGAIVAKGSTVTIQASASDSVGVTKVEFYAGPKVTCTDTTSPYSCAWKAPNSPSKTTSFSAKAYNAAGGVGTSGAVTVTTGK